MAVGTESGFWKMREDTAGDRDVSPVPLMCIRGIESSGRTNLVVAIAVADALLGTRRFGSQVMAAPILSETEESEIEGACVEMRTLSTVGDDNVNRCV